jgi:ferric-dicitrate binding protein FerR (iron transport regulator)
MNDNDDADTALRLGLRAEPLSAEALERIRIATAHAWRAETNAVSRSRPRWRLGYALAASIALLAISVGWWANFKPSHGVGAALGRVERADAPGIVEQHRWSADLALLAGETLRSGQRLRMRGAARIALAATGTLHVLAGSGLEIVSSEHIRLLDGALYLDFPPEANRARRFVVQTAVGQFEHMGTQFSIEATAQQTKLRVREGRVQWRSASDGTIVEAGTELSIDKRGTVTRRPISTSGPEWAWAEALRPPFAIEGRSLAEFLAHAARETGRKLIYADVATQKRAQATMLHGSVQGLGLADGLSTLMATTSLHLELDGASIRVSFAGESPKSVK